MEEEIEVGPLNMENDVPNSETTIPNRESSAPNIDNDIGTSDEFQTSPVTTIENTDSAEETSATLSWTIGDPDEESNGENGGLEPTQDAPQHQVIDIEPVTTDSIEESGSSNANIDSNINSTLQTDHEHSHSQVIEVEEFTSESNTTHDVTHNVTYDVTHDEAHCAEEDVTCNCHCHSKERSLSRGKTIIINGRHTQQSNSSSAAVLPIRQYGHTISYGPSNQSNSSISSVLSQSNSLPLRISQSGPSMMRTNNDIEMGIQNQAFSVVRVDSNLSRASNNSVKPPAYKTLGEFYLHDEPPKYENITGNKLADDLQDQTSSTPTRPVVTRSRLSCKSRVAGAFILFGIILITGLLVYLSVTSENSQQNNLSKS